jgi:hypothetical protein
MKRKSLARNQADLGTHEDPFTRLALWATAGRAGVPMGIFSGSADAAESARAKWYRYNVVGSDLMMLTTGAAALRGC